MERIATDSINAGETAFRISYPSEDTHLTDSIRRHGIVSPLVLLDTWPRTVVAGFRRLRAAFELGIRDIPCVVTRMTDQEALLTAIMDNAPRGLNLVEIAHAAEKMGRLGLPEREAQDIIGFIADPSAARACALLCSVAAADEATKEFIVRHGVTLRTAEYLFGFDEPDRGRIVSLLSGLRSTTSLTRDILRLCALIKAREGTGFLERVAGAVDANTLRKLLKAVANPRLTTMEAEYDGLLASAHLPPSMDVSTDPFFEKETLEVSIRVRTQAEIDDALERLGRVSRAGIFRSMLELIRGSAGGN